MPTPPHPVSSQTNSNSMNKHEFPTYSVAIGGSSINGDTGLPIQAHPINDAPNIEHTFIFEAESAAAPNVLQADASDQKTSQQPLFFSFQDLGFEVQDEEHKEVSEATYDNINNNNKSYQCERQHDDHEDAALLHLLESINNFNELHESCPTSLMQRNNPYHEPKRYDPSRSIIRKHMALSKLRGHRNHAAAELADDIDGIQDGTEIRMKKIRVSNVGRFFRRRSQHPATGTGMGTEVHMMAGDNYLNSKAASYSLV